MVLVETNSPPCDTQLTLKVVAPATGSRRYTHRGSLYSLVTKQFEATP